MRDEADQTRGGRTDVTAADRDRHQTGRYGRRWLALAAIVVLLAVLRHAGLSDPVQDVQRMQAFMASMEPWSGVVAVVALAVLYTLGFPRIFLNGMAGMFFGAGLGFLIGHLGTWIGAYCMFKILVWFRGDEVPRVLTRQPWAKPLLNRRGLMDVVVVRQIPVYAFLQNLLLAVSGVRDGTFLLGTLIGSLPGTLVAVFLGASFGEANGLGALWPLGVALAAMGVSLWISHRLRRTERIRAT